MIPVPETPDRVFARIATAAYRYHVDVAGMLADGWDYFGCEHRFVCEDGLGPEWGNDAIRCEHCDLPRGFVDTARLDPGEGYVWRCTGGCGTEHAELRRWENGDVPDHEGDLLPCSQCYADDPRTAENCDGCGQWWACELNEYPALITFAYEDGAPAVLCPACTAQVETTPARGGRD